MSKIVIVHGIANQFEGSTALRAAWHPALCDGLLLAGFSPLPELSDCACPFWGDLFRLTGHLGSEVPLTEADIDEASGDEALLVEAVWRAAIEEELDLTRPEDFEDTLVATPRVVERALTSLAKSKFLADRIPLQFFGDLRQVVAYLNDKGLRSKMLDRVLAHIADDTRVVIGHSLGSVIAYEAICAKPARVTALLTLGSPLGIRNVVFDKLTPAPEAGRGAWPGHVRSWTNIAARGDIVAAQKTLAELFDGDIDDRLIDSGWDAHSSTRYLNALQSGTALAAALAG